ncbi:HigA family addiction module antidote protein [Azospirillum sp. YIM DDC1]|uniref:HigA family addiction module antidote protein n=1 Tax=Azospirillum aestuarii TaxID=2802052 RepID=A0ABS1I6P7_9PROT|nr:HigA family addiction module antidote protein [Azospirillum aestuarii]
MERRPTPPGRFIQSDILEEYGLTQDQLAQRLRVSRLTVNELVKGKRALTASMALRLGRLTGQSPDYWLALQRAIDLWDAQEEVDNRTIEEIEPLQSHTE